MWVVRFADVDGNFAAVEHDKAVAVGDGVAHVVGDHDGGQPIFGDDLIGDLKNFGSRLWVEGCGVFIKQEDIRPLEGGHEQCQSLALSAGQKADARGESFFKAEAKHGQPFLEEGSVF